jgi:hypothetical protein
MSLLGDVEPTLELPRRHFMRPVMLVGGGFFGRMSLVGMEALRGTSVVGMLPLVGAGPVLMGLTEPRKLGLSVVGIEPLVAFGVRGMGRDCWP